MANENKLFKRCEACGGNGTIKQLNTTSNPYGEGWVDVTCSRCLGSGVLPSGQMVLPDDCFMSWQVLDCVDPTEYAALVDAAKDGLRIILSVGVLFLGSGSKQLTNLRAIFPVGKVTRTALEALIA